MDYRILQEKLRDISQIVDETEFLKALLLAYKLPKALFARLDIETILDYKPLRITNKMYYLLTKHENLYSELDKLREENFARIPVRFVVIVNETNLLAFDTITEETINTPRLLLYKHYDYFLPLSGVEKSKIVSNTSVDITTASKFAHLYNELLLINEHIENRDHINRFILRILFLFFADSENVIKRGTLHKLIFTHSSEDGSSLNQLFNEIFNRIVGNDSHLPDYIKQIPVMNYHLFQSGIVDLNFNKECRKSLLEISELNWSDISPDVLGALIQSIVNEADSDNNNFTSEPNINKLIGPLFLNELYDNYESNKQDKDELNNLLHRISRIKIFDPSCGTGNFLLVAYRELRTLEFKIKRQLSRITGVDAEIPLAEFDAENLYGIESNRLSCQVAKLGLLFTMCQINRRLFDKKNSFYDLLQIVESNRLVSDNALQVNWEEFCPNNQEVYVIGNPSYKGAHKLNSDQKRDLINVFSQFEKMGEVDYSGAYFYLAAKYIKKNYNSAFAFVTTNSLTQGQQVDLLWPKLFELGVHISFAHSAFKWKNDAINNTAVTVVIIGIRNNGSSNKRIIFSSQHAKKVSWINPYLAPGELIVKKKSKPISQLPKMVKGNMPYDDNHLLLTGKEASDLIKEYPVSRRFLKRVVGSREFINGLERWCLWIDDGELEIALSVPAIKTRIEAVKIMRLNKKDKNAQKLSKRAHQFREHRQTESYSLVIPSVSSERRLYIPVGFINNKVIVTNLAFVIYDCEPWIFAVVSSKMHNLWVRTVCGQLETRIRYSSQLGYNTFPFPNINEDIKKELNECVYMVLAEREKLSEQPLGYMYNPETITEGLIYAHSLLDKVVERCYREEEFLSDQDRLEHLFELYNEMEDK